jgi:hypothetical protein
MEVKALPLGIDDFEKLRKNNFYYIDKSLLIKELIDNRCEVSLFTRPRRFGKSLNLSMLQYFFEIRRESMPLFDGLKIMTEGERYLSHMNRYPVIMLSLKAADQNTFNASFQLLKEELIREFQRHDYLLESDKIKDYTKLKLRKILAETATKDEYKNSINFLSKCLEQHFGEKVIILIDEYDVPLEKTFFKDYYEEMIEFVRSLLNTALKTNTSLAFAVMTRCLRISKESIFTGLNNLNIITILTNQYGEYFGFTTAEVESGLKYYHLEHKKELVTNWYNGYYFGKKTVYNPWSFIKYLWSAKGDETSYPAPHWSNTSSNSIVRTLIDLAGPKEKEEIEKLIQGGTITVPICEDITFEDITSSPENLWNFLFFTGYLKNCSESFNRNTLYLELCIPNEEVRYIYQKKIEEWMKDTILSQRHVGLYERMLGGDAKHFEAELNVCLKRAISYMDTRENYYHGFLTGVLDNMGDYQVKYNRESGNGRGDIFVTSYYNKKIAVIIETKIATSYQSLGKFCDEALNQIEEKKYIEELQSVGYYNILKYGIAFFKKDCKIKMG